MPQRFPAGPSSRSAQRPERRTQLRRPVRRALVAASALLAVAPAGAAADTGGAEFGDPAAESRTVSAPVAATVTVSARPDRAAVRAVQRRLRLRVDGVYGPQTRAAVRRFQRRNGLRADGRLRASTLRALGVRARAANRTIAGPAGPTPTGRAAELLKLIAACESGGDPKAVSADGQYRGKYQFLTSTWASMGGVGDPADAPESEQDRRAGKLLAAQGTKPWPVCGRKARAAVS